jgi:hypothetical protein
MNVTIESFALDPADSEAVANRVGIAAGIVADYLPNHEKLTLVFSGDLRTSIRDRTDDDWERENYEIDRLFGQVGARVMHHDDGHVDLIFHGGLIHPDTPEDELRSTVHHEALHAVLHERGESLADIRIRHDVPSGTRHGEFLAMAGIAAEEFRVEMAVAQMGTGRAVARQEALVDTLQAFRNEVVDGMRIRYPGETIERCCQTVLTAFHRATLYLAYMAAEEVSGSTALAVEGPEWWPWLVGDHYDHYRNLLSAMPSASKPTLLSDLDRTTLAVREHLEEWLGDIGFWLEDRQGDELYFGVDQERVVPAMMAE